MRGRIIKEIEGSFRGMHIRNADIMPNWSDICSTADIPKLSEIAYKGCCHIRLEQKIEMTRVL